MKIYENNHRYSHSFVVEYMHEVNRMNWLTELETYKDAFIQDLRGLIAIPSVRDDKTKAANAPFGAGCRKALDYMLELGKREGFQIKDYDGYAGVIAYGEGEESVGVLAHLDIVPIGEGWSRDPFGGEIVDGYMFGRGTLDDKGPAMAGFYALKMLKDKGVFYTPTLAATSIKYSSTWTKNLSKEVVDRLTTARAMHLQSCGYAIQNGVAICCGTDTLPSDQFDGTYSTNFEMELLVEAGMTPLQAIQAATGNSADLCELTNVTGRLKAGLAGDVIAVKGCPDQNIKDMRNLSMVIRDCRVAWSDLDGFEAPKTLLPPSIEIPEVCGASNPW